MLAGKKMPPPPPLLCYFPLGWPLPQSATRKPVLDRLAVERFPIARDACGCPRSCMSARRCLAQTAVTTAAAATPAAIFAAIADAAERGGV